MLCADQVRSLCWVQTKYEVCVECRPSAKFVLSADQVQSLCCVQTEHKCFEVYATKDGSEFTLSMHKDCEDPIGWCLLSKGTDRVSIINAKNWEDLIMYAIQKHRQMLYVAIHKDCLSCNKVATGYKSLLLTASSGFSPRHLLTVMTVM